MTTTDPLDRAAEALWDRTRDHHEDPPWGDPELHARFEQSFRDDARAAITAALDREGLERALAEADNYNLCEVGCGGDIGPFHQRTGPYRCHYAEQADAVIAHLTGGAS